MAHLLSCAVVVFTLAVVYIHRTLACVHYLVLSYHMEAKGAVCTCFMLVMLAYTPINVKNQNISSYSIIGIEAVYINQHLLLWA